MAAERIYEQQTAPQAGTAMPMRDPREFGAGIGEAMQQLGGQIHSQQLRAFQVDRKIDQDRQVADWSHRFSLHRENMDGITRQARNTAQPGGVGHGQTVREANEAARETLFDGISDPAARRMAEQQWDSYSGSLYGQEADWEEGQRVAKSLNDTQATNQIGFNRIRRSSDPQVYKQELGFALERNAMLNVAPDVRDKLDKWTTQGAAVAFVQNLQDSNPAMARAVLDSGEFDFLPPETLESLRSGADVEIRRAQAKAEHDAQVAKAAAREGIATLEEANRQGLVIEDSEFDKAITAARNMGDDSTALKLEGLKSDNGFARIYQSQSPAQREAALTKLKAVKKPSLAQQREIKWLEDKRGTLDERFGSDMVGWAIENGSPPPPGDINDPAALQARVAWSRTMGQVYGRPDFPILSRAEAGQLQATRGSGPQGELAALDWIDKLPDEGARQKAALQIAPADDEGAAQFRHLALINPAARPRFMRGREALAANPRLLTPEKTDFQTKGTIEEVDKEAWDAMRLLRPADAAATKTLAYQYVAGIAAAQNIPVDKLPRSLWVRAYRQALGGGVIRDAKGNERQVGGYAMWGSQAYLLPSRHDQASFAGALLADSKARKINPVNPDGSFFDVKNAIPVFLRIDPQDPNVWLYRFEDRSGRVVQSSAGGDYIARVKDR